MEEKTRSMLMMTLENGKEPEIESYWPKIFNIYINHYDKNSKLYSKIIHSVFIEKQTYLWNGL